MTSRYHRAAADGNLELLKEATRKDLNASDEDGMTPTLLAAYHGRLEALEIICRRGKGGFPTEAQCRTRSPHGPHAAGRRGTRHTQPGDVSASVSPSARTARLPSSRRCGPHVRVTRGHRSASFFLLGRQGKRNRGASNRTAPQITDSNPGMRGDPDKCDIWGNTPLHHAACNGHIHCVSFLVNFGANIFALDNELRTALDVAASRDRHECVRLLDRAATEQNVANPRKVSRQKAQAQRNMEKQIKECEKRQEKHQHEMNRSYMKEKAGSVTSSRGTQPRVKLPTLFTSNTAAPFSKNLKDTFKLKAKRTAGSTRSQEPQSNGQADGRDRGSVMDLFDEKEEDDLPDDDSQLSIFTRPGLGRIVFGRNLAADIDPGTTSSEKEGISFKMSSELFQNENAESSAEGEAGRGVEVPWQEEELLWDDEEAESTPLEVFLASQMLDEFLPVFMREKMDLDALMLCSDEDLQSIQVELGPRKKVLSAVSKRKQAFQDPGKTVDTCL